MKREGRMGGEGRGENRRAPFTRGHAAPGPPPSGPGLPQRGEAGAQGGWFETRWGGAERSSGRALRGTGMKRSPARSWSWCVSLSSGLRGSS